MRKRQDFGRFALILVALSSYMAVAGALSPLPNRGLSEMSFRTIDSVFARVAVHSKLNKQVLLASVGPSLKRMMDATNAKAPENDLLLAKLKQKLEALQKQKSKFSPEELERLMDVAAALHKNGVDLAHIESIVMGVANQLAAGQELKASLFDKGLNALPPGELGTGLKELKETIVAVVGSPAIRPGAGPTTAKATSSASVTNPAAAEKGLKPADPELVARLAPEYVGGEVFQNENGDLVVLDTDGKVLTTIAGNGNGTSGSVNSGSAGSSSSGAVGAGGGDAQVAALEVSNRHNAITVTPGEKKPEQTAMSSEQEPSTKTKAPTITPPKETPAPKQKAETNVSGRALASNPQNYSSGAAPQNPQSPQQQAAQDAADQYDRTRELSDDPANSPAVQNAWNNWEKARQAAGIPAIPQNVIGAGTDSLGSQLRGRPSHGFAHAYGRVIQNSGLVGTRALGQFGVVTKKRKDFCSTLASGGQAARDEFVKAIVNVESKAIDGIGADQVRDYYDRLPSILNYGKVPQDISKKALDLRDWLSNTGRLSACEQEVAPTFKNRDPRVAAALTESWCYSLKERAHMNNWVRYSPERGKDNPENGFIYDDAVMEAIYGCPQNNLGAKVIADLLSQKTFQKAAQDCGVVEAYLPSPAQMLWARKDKDWSAKHYIEQLEGNSKRGIGKSTNELGKTSYLGQPQVRDTLRKDLGLSGGMVTCEQVASLEKFLYHTASNPRFPTDVFGPAPSKATQNSNVRFAKEEPSAEVYGTVVGNSSSHSAQGSSAPIEQLRAVELPPLRVPELDATALSMDVPRAYQSGGEGSTTLQFNANWGDGRSASGTRKELGDGRSNQD